VRLVAEIDLIGVPFDGYGRSGNQARAAGGAAGCGTAGRLRPPPRGMLDHLEFPAQGLPDVEDEPGGPTWDQLTDLVRAMLDSGSCVGAGIAIYDPDQDEDGTGAGQIMTFVRTIVGGYRAGR
jgi:hypothetical protein